MPSLVTPRSAHVASYVDWLPTLETDVRYKGCLVCQVDHRMQDKRNKIGYCYALNSYKHPNLRYVEVDCSKLVDSKVYIGRIRNPDELA